MEQEQVLEVGDLVTYPVGDQVLSYRWHDWELGDAPTVPTTAGRSARRAAGPSMQERELAARAWAVHGVDPGGPLPDEHAGALARGRRALDRELRLTPSVRQLLDPRNDPYGMDAAFAELPGRLPLWAQRLIPVVCLGALVVAGVVNALQH